ncbi:MAG: hypothetical protein A2900_01020 [Candidatus Chisholmbacteria bacterium RIFCSPLOWO2_01_FULL_50_28]|uniref:Kazal-like domain-containing protein n=1 Tax=Candidatus Chisholmbacteria bacterium RIFCSPHIGHO2_01_FULL_52_32 TaxID=1797591 RepID=A0A1G1VUJ4_9BACT|nr:MAG: hypothetical protein A2786_06080 [Candidatus Chisholmbacteria bacterium RIFCSPHIGHO2_01_FULL_52_32]OGY19671.1 MAG: hypothetical protein A2900_01020 [Candidatus Chisholmbacteria bacterium RIFCSPLOWO2_01_FULL_50_28]
MDQETEKNDPSFWEKPKGKTSTNQGYKIDNRRIESLKQGFLFGISASDLFILLAALLAVIVLQVGPKAFEALETSSQITENGNEEGAGFAAPTLPPGAPQDQATESGTGKVTSEKVVCKTPRPEVCTQECLTGPPYICGSGGRAHCSPCQACADPNVAWYVLQSTPCGEAVNPSL